VNNARTKAGAKGARKVKDPVKSTVSAHSPAKARTKSPVPAENPKLAELKLRYFSKKGRTARIKRAEQALIVIDRVGSSFKLDKNTVNWLAEDPDLEYL
jgi:hypothetical protein